MISADELLSINDLRQKKIFVAQWNREITIQELGLLPMMEMYQSLDAKEIAEGSVKVKPLDIARFVALGVLDESGNRVFKDEHIEALANKNHEALTFIYSEIMALSGSDEDAEKN